MQTSTIKRLMPFLLLLACLAYNLEAKIDNVFPNGAIVRDGTNSDIKYLNYKTGEALPSYQEGRIFYDSGTAALSYYPAIQGSIMQIGQELWIYGYNAGVATITNGMAVRCTGSLFGILPVMTPSKADASSTARVDAICTGNVSPSSAGLFTVQGTLNDVDTSAFVVGDELFLSAATAGALTNAEPAAPNMIIKCGIVTKSHASEGKIQACIHIRGALGRAQFADGLDSIGSISESGIALGNKYSTIAYVDQTAGELEESLLQGSLRLYYVTATDSVTGGRLLATYTQGVATYINYAALSSTVYVQVNNPPRLSVTEEPGVATLSAGEIRAVRYMSSDQAISTNRSVTGINELWMVDADGSTDPVFVATSSTYVVLGTEIQRIVTAYVLPTDVSTGGTTRRFLEKHFRKRTGTTTGSKPIVRVYYGGANESFMTLVLPSAVVMKTDASNSILPAARTSLDVYSKDESRAYTDTLATASALSLTNHNNTSTAHNATTLASEAYVTGYAAPKAGNAAQDFSAAALIAGSESVVLNGRYDATYPIGYPGFFQLKTNNQGATIGGLDIFTCDSGMNLVLTLDRDKNASFSGDVRAQSFTLGGNLNTGTNWISGDGGNEGIYVDGSGNVGVGTTTARGLTVVGNNLNSTSQLQVGNAIDSTTRLHFGEFANTSYMSHNYLYNAGQAYDDISKPSSTITMDEAIRFRVGAAGDVPSEKMQLSGTGELLIATTTDAGDYKLQVNGNAYVNGTISGADTWHNASGTYLNSWEDNDASNPLQYRKMPDGTVFLRGEAKSGTIGQIIFQLPLGYRPAYSMNFAIVSNGLFGHCAVTTDGNVYAFVGSNVYFSVTGVSFPTN